MAFSSSRNNWEISGAPQPGKDEACAADILSFLAASLLLIELRRLDGSQLQKDRCWAREEKFWILDWDGKWWKGRQCGTFVHMYVYTLIYVCIYIYIFDICIQTYTCICIHTHTHTYIWCSFEGTWTFWKKVRWLSWQKVGCRNGQVYYASLRNCRCISPNSPWVMKLVSFKWF